MLLLSLPIVAWVASHAPVPQNLAYHNFADQRALYGIPHFWNVVSNLPFAIIGVLGCSWIVRAGRTSPAFEEPSERTAYFVFFLGEILTCFGSGYYHAAPANGTLVWDRLVLSLMLTSIFPIVIAEFVNRDLGRLMLGPMVALGVFSIIYWAWTEQVGAGDLRPYLLVQFYPVLAIPLILLLFGSRYTHTGMFWLIWALYAIAKLAELYDGAIYAWGGVWSGHTIKHLVAAGASYMPLYALKRRRPRSRDAVIVGLERSPRPQPV